MEDNIKIDNKQVRCRVCTGFICIRTGPMSGFCEHNNEPSNCIIATDETHYPVCKGTSAEFAFLLWLIYGAVSISLYSVRW
jgi:hypothetical protein